MSPSSDGTPKIWQRIAATTGDQLVLYAWDDQPPAFSNLARLDEAGRTVWIVQPIHPLEGVYTTITFRDACLSAYNMSGYLETIDYETGRVLSRKFVK